MSDLIDALDGALAAVGEDVVLRRIVGTGANVANIDVTCRAAVRSPTAQELRAGFVQTDSVVILSPTQIRAAQWPGGVPAGTVHPELPRKGDKLRIQGRSRAVESVNPIFVAGELVRIELRVLG